MENLFVMGLEAADASGSRTLRRIAGAVLLILCLACPGWVGRQVVAAGRHRAEMLAPAIRAVTQTPVRVAPTPGR